MGEDEGHSNMIDEEHCLRSITFLLIIHVETASSQFDFLTVWSFDSYELLVVQADQR